MPYLYQLAFTASHTWRRWGWLIRFIERLHTLEQWPPLKAALLSLPPWITPNGISVFRTVLVVPIAALLAWNRHIDAVTAIVLAALAVAAVSVSLDAVDGWLARVRDQCSAKGARLDPLMDKLTIAAIMVTTFAFNQPPRHAVGFMASVTLSELAIHMSRYYSVKRKPTHDDQQQLARDAAKWHGKIKMTFECLTVLAFIAAPLDPRLWVIGSVFALCAFPFGALSLVSKMRP
jgi:phosphatidylglycerophosphate synthase